MANSTTNIDVADELQEDILDVLNGNHDAGSMAMFGGRHASTCVALTFGVYGGISPLSGNFIANTTFALTANLTNYIRLNRDDTFTVTTSAPTGWPTALADGAWPDYDCLCGASTVTSYNDRRRFGAPPILGIPYAYSSTTAAADPGSGTLRFNNTTLASVTALYISETDGLGRAIAAEIATWDDSTNTIKAKFTVQKTSDPTKYAIYNITGTNTDNGTWVTVTLAYVTGNGALTNGDAVTLTVLRNGDVGSAASITGTGFAYVTAGVIDAAAKTPTAATAVLDAVVGDSGAGGTKGLVPAPAAGDAAAGKFLKADGTFAVPPGTFAGGTLTSTLTLRTGGTAAGSDPLKFVSGALLTAPVAGTVEFLTDKWYATIATGTARKELTLNDSALTAGGIPIITTNGRLAYDANVAYDAANARLNLFGAPTTNGQDIYARKTVNGSLAFAIQNLSTGTGAYAALALQNSANTGIIEKLSTGYTTNGLLVADQLVTYNTSGTMLFSNAASAAIIFAVGGFAAANEIARFSAAALTIADATNVVLNATTGTKIGTATTQKLGFWNATPVVQKTGYGTPTNAANQGSFDATTITLPNLAAHVAQLCLDLKAIGIVGA